MSLKCTKCDFKSQTASNLKLHTKTHSISIPIFSCEDCGYADALEENLLNHKVAKHSVFTCDRCDDIFSHEKELNDHMLKVHKPDDSNQFKCDECKFISTKEEVVLNHKITKHSIHTCELCEFKCNEEHNLSIHIESVHNVTKHPCNICKKVFTTLSNLKNHKKSVHTIQTFPCDHCGYKAEGFEKLDEHIEGYHRIRKDPSNKKFSTLNKDPCDFKNPWHSSSCCDRDQGPKMKIFTPEERINNGPCRNWNENFCRFSDLCRFAHIEPCRFQDRCFAPSNCRFFHFNRSNASFLGGKVFRSQPFKLDPKEFPPLQKQTSLKHQKNHL